jgi:cephalosporin-C deacetylase
MSRGIRDPSDYYYRRLFTDAVRAVEVARELRSVDPGRVWVAGESQGGGVALAAAALGPRVAGALVDVPFLCHFPRAVTLASQGPYLEIVSYLATHQDAEATVFRTLSYFDGVNMARRVTAPVMFSVALMDPVCPPSTVYAAANWCAASDSEVVAYPFNGHEGGRPHQWDRQASFVRQRTGKTKVDSGIDQ